MAETWLEVVSSFPGDSIATFISISGYSEKQLNSTYQRVNARLIMYLRTLAGQKIGRGIIKYEVQIQFTWRVNCMHH